MPKSIEDAKMIYLSWVNDFLTVARLAEYYEISEEHATLIIDLGHATDNFTKGGEW